MGLKSKGNKMFRSLSSNRTPLPPTIPEFGRRKFLEFVAGAAILGVESRADSPAIQTVLGEIQPKELGLTLMHEHVLVDFIGADKIEQGRYSPDEAFNTALPHLLSVRKRGCRSLVECTPAYIGRDPVLLRRLSKASGLHIITNTGYYAAGGNKYIPSHAFTESAEDLARRWTSEFHQGIAGSGIRPGLIKIGVDRGPLSEIGRKLARAAAMTHRRTGLSIASHTGDGIAAIEQLDILEKEGVSASAFIWVHAQNEKQAEIHLQVAGRGAWLEFDGISPATAKRHAELVFMIVEKRFGRQVLVSMDAGWYHVGEAGGGNYRGYTSLFEDFLPALHDRGVDEQLTAELLSENPRRALQPSIKPAKK